MLWTFSHGHGLTVADLLPPALTALILWRSRPTHRATRRPAHRAPHPA